MNHATYLQIIEAVFQRCQEYYTEGRPTVTDQEYDGMLRDLQLFEAKHPDLVHPQSPTQRMMGALLGGFPKVQHVEPMLSLSNLFNEEEVATFCASVLKAAPQAADYGMCIEPKVDGLSIELVYRDRQFVQAVTRGDGKTGDDVTRQVRTIRNLPLLLFNDAPAGELRIRGEVYMPIAVFQRLNEELLLSEEDPLANPRNAAAGALKQKDPAETARRQLSVICYQELNSASECRVDMMKQLHRWGLPVFQVGTMLVPVEASTIFSALAGLDVLRKSFPYMTDGAVLKLNQMAAQDQLGSNSKAPLWAAAFKYPAEEAVTKLRGITVQAGRHGTLTPVAEVEPVWIGGSTVSRASLHNWQEIARLDVRIGDEVVLIKAGEIIPKVVRANPEKRTGQEVVPVEPKQCPFCGRAAERDEEDAVMVRCVNYGCPEVTRRRLHHAVSKEALNVVGLGPSVIDKLMQSGDVRTVWGLFGVSHEMLKAAGLSDKQAHKVHAALKTARQTADQANLLYSLSIPHVGRTASRALLSCFGGLEKMSKASSSDLEACPDLLPIPAASLTRWLVEGSGRVSGFDIIANLEEAGFDISCKAPEVKGSILEGQVWVITGTLSADRSVFEAMIRGQGGKTSGSVSAKTTALLVGDKAGSKLDKAAKLGVKAYSETEFRKLLGI